MVYGLGFLLLFGGRIISEHLQSVAQGAEKPEMRRVREGVLLRSEMVLLQSLLKRNPKCGELEKEESCHVQRATVENGEQITWELAFAT
jgi:hypothetical protein